VNDVSRELGAALGVAVVGSAVSGFYRASIEQELAGSLPPEAVHNAGEGLGMVAVIANSLPADAAARLVEAANIAFVDAISLGFLISAAVLVAPITVAAMFLPGRNRATTEADVVGTTATVVEPVAAS
jgi:DHA2 family multidrug resistance protein-like MFS transporter